MDYRTHLKKICKWLVLIISILLILTGTIWGLAQTELGKNFLAQWISQQLGKDPSFQVKIGKITGIIPFNIRLDEFTISDRGSQWLVVKNIFISWSPNHLIKGRIYVDELSATAVHLKHLPTARGGKKKRKPGKMTLSDSIPPLHIHRLNLESIYLGESILGSKAIFTMKGQTTAGDHEKTLKGSLHIDRKDGTNAFYYIDWSLAGGTIPEIEFDLGAKEEKDGLLTNLMGVKDTGPVTISLKGKGPISFWKGHLKAEADRLGSIDTALEVMINDVLRLKGNGHVMLSQRLFEKDIQAFNMSQKTLFHFNSRIHAGHNIEIQRVFLKNNGITLNLAGRIELEKRHIQSDFNLQIDNLSRFKGLVNQRIQGMLDLQGRLEGTFKQPRATLSVTLKEPGVGKIHASNLFLNARLTPTLMSASNYQGLSGQIKGHVKGLAHKTRGALIPADECHFFLSAEAQKGGPINVNELKVFGKDFVAHFSGQLNSRSSFIEGDASMVIHDLSNLSNIIGTKVHGKAIMNAHLNGNLQSRSLSADIKGQIAVVEPLPESLAPVLEEDLKYACHMRLEQGRHLTVTDLAISSVVGEIETDASLDIPAGDILAHGLIRIPRLAAFSKTLGRPINGAFEMEVDVGGVLKNPKITAQADLSHLRIKHINVSKAKLSLMARNLFHEPEGELEIHIQGPGHSLKAASNFTFISPRLSFNDLSASSLGTEMTGDLEIDLKRHTSKGALRGSCIDLASFSALFGKKVEGNARFDIVLSDAGGRQDVALDLQGKGLDTGYGAVEALTLSLSLKNVLQAPEGNAEVEINSFKKEALQIGHMILKAEGQKEKAAFKAHAQGYYKEEFQFDTTGSIGLMPGSNDLRLTQLKGNFGEFTISAREPVVIRKISENYILERADFLLDDGHLEAFGRLESETMTFDARLDTLSLSFLKAFGYPEVSGTATARLHIEGLITSPKADMDIQLEKLKFKGTLSEEFPPANLLAHITLKNHDLKADLTLANLADKPLKAGLNLPVDLSFLPFVFSLRSEDGLKGRILAEMELEHLSSFFYLEDHTLKGNLVIDLAIDGTMEKPSLNGHVLLSDGIYENVRSGTLIKDIQIVAGLIEDKLILEKARATDGEKGTIVAKGSINLLPKKLLPFQLELLMDNASLVRRDDLTVTTSGKLDLSGSMERMDVSGSLTLGPAALRIPESLPPDARDLNIKEINMPVQKSPPKRSPPLKTKGRLNLDILLEIPGKVFVRGRGLDSEWKGKVGIKGSEQQPAVTGSLSVIRGRYNFFGKSFSLTNGSVNLNSGTPASTKFDAIAEHKSSDITYRILVSGDLSTFKMDMESDPPMPPDEIMARLLFGRSATDITPLQAFRLAQAIDSLRGGGGMFSFMDRTRSLIGVDELNIKQSDDKSGEPSVSAGKYIRDNVYLEVEQGMGPDTGKVSVEIELTPHIAVETDMGKNGQGGIGLNWKWDY